MNPGQLHERGPVRDTTHLATGALTKSWSNLRERAFSPGFCLLKICSLSYNAMDLSQCSKCFFLIFLSVMYYIVMLSVNQSNNNLLLAIKLGRKERKLDF